MFRLLIFSLISYEYAYSAETVKVAAECAKQCTCTDHHISDLPMMKWKQVRLDRETKQNESLMLNRVHDDGQEFSEKNPLVTAAFCVFQEDSHEIRAEQFFPQIEALTILYGRDTVNKTIEYELSDFGDLLALDIQGYENVGSSPDADVSLHPNALLSLENLRYLNIEHVFLFPNPNTTADEEPVVNQNYPPFEKLEQRRNELEQRRSRVNLQFASSNPSTLVSYDEYSYELEQLDEQRSNVTFVLSDEPQIITYDQFKKQQNLISTFSHLSNLLFLRLYRCHLETITWDMFKDLSVLQMLSLEGNHIVEIPKLAFFSMPGLKILILAGNRLEHLDLESLAGLFQLEYLDLSRNNFQHLSETTFAPLPKLRDLDLRDNPVQTIYSNTFEVLGSTENLHMGGWQPLSIHANAFRGLDSLQRLVITGLNAEVLDYNLLHGMPKLKYLKINGNVDNVDFDAFTDSLELEVLILKNCSLHYVSVDAFFALFDLKILDLSWNHLESLAPGIFNQLDSLTELILAHNRFVELPGVLDGLQHVKSIRLEHNPWHCTCDMAGWRSLNWNKVRERREVDAPCTYKYDKRLCAASVADFYMLSANAMPKCATPEEFRGFSVLHVLNKKLKCDDRAAGREAAEWTLPEGGAKDQRAPKKRYPKKQPKYKSNGEEHSNNAGMKNTKYQSDENVDNSLRDLSQFIHDAESSKSPRNVNPNKI